MQQLPRSRGEGLEEALHFQSARKLFCRLGRCSAAHRCTPSHIGTLNGYFSRAGIPPNSLRVTWGAVPLRAAWPGQGPGWVGMSLPRCLAAVRARRVAEVPSPVLKGTTVVLGAPPRVSNSTGRLPGTSLRCYYYPVGVCECGEEGERTCSGTKIQPHQGEPDWD